MNVRSDSNTPTGRRQPAYARLAAQRFFKLIEWRRGYYPDASDADLRAGIDLIVFCGANAWAGGRGELLPINRRVPLVLPLGDDPGTYDWRVVAGTAPWVIAAGGGMSDGDLRRLALYLLTSGALQINVSHWPNLTSTMNVYRRDHDTA